MKKCRVAEEAQLMLPPPLQRLNYFTDFFYRKRIILVFWWCSGGGCYPRSTPPQYTPLLMVVVVDKENGKMGKKKVKDGKTKKKFFVCIFTKFVEQSIFLVVVAMRWSRWWQKKMYLFLWCYLVGLSIL